MHESLIQEPRSQECFGRAAIADRVGVGLDAVADVSATRFRKPWAWGNSDTAAQDFEPMPVGDQAYDCDDLVDQLTIFQKILCGREVILRAIRSAHRTSLRALFCLSPPPQLDALVGEYDAELLDQGSWLSNVAIKSLFRTQGCWIGKAFHPLGQTNGVGYNLFRSRGSVVRKLPMETHITESALDPGLSLQISYRGKNEGFIEGLTGELRQVTNNVLIGMGVFGPCIGGRDLWRRKIPFLLVGPSGSFQHQAAK